MNKPYDKLKVILFDEENNPNDITIGTVAINIEEGVGSWEGDWQQPDYGSFVLVSRNTSLDPLINPYVKFNNKVSFYTNEESNGTPYNAPIFTGYITDINVEYSPDGKSIITIRGTDLIGIFKRTLIDQNILDYLYDYNGNEPFTFKGCLEGIQQYFLENNIVAFNTRFENGEETGGSLGIPFIGYRPATYIPQIGESVLDVLVKYAQTNLDTISTRVDETYPYPELYIRSFLKYNPLYFILIDNPLTDAEHTFDSVNEPYQGYTNILVSQNFDKVVNQIYINNTSTTYNNTTHEAEYTNTNFDPFVLETSIESNGFSQLSLDLLMPADKANTTELTRYTRDIFEETGVLKFEVNEIEFNYLNRELSSYYCGETIRVTHRVSPSIVIDRIYKIAGIKHDITENTWYTTYSLKPSDAQRVYDHQQENNYADASISMNALSGDTNYNFTATLTDFPAEMIDVVHWYVASDALYYEDGQTYDYSQSGESFKNNVPRTGNSLTLNFDDDGILEFGYYGPGDKFIAAVVTDINGYTFIVKKLITVTSAQAYSNFVYTKNSYDGYTFLDASGVDTDTWSWNFGDGTTSTLKNPPIKYYNNSGTYNVSLTVDNGITTSTKTIPITVTSTLIPVKYLKYEFKGIRNRANGSSPWDKHFLRYISLIQGNLGEGSSLSYNCPTEIVVNKGTAVINGNNATAPTPNSYPTDNFLYGPGYTTLSTDIKLNPLVTNSGNTEEYDISLIVDISKKISQKTTNGLVTATIHNTQWDGINNNDRFNLYDSWFVPHGWELNIHYEPVNVYVSADGINYYKIGDQNLYRTTYPPSNQTLVLALDNKPVMPPRFPT